MAEWWRICSRGWVLQHLMFTESWNAIEPPTWQLEMTSKFSLALAYQLVGRQEDIEKEVACSHQIRDLKGPLCHSLTLWFARHMSLLTNVSSFNGTLVPLRSVRFVVLHRILSFMMFGLSPSSPTFGAVCAAQA